MLTRSLQGLAWLIVAGLVAEFYLAGAALFGVTTSFAPHRALGGVLAVAIVLLLVLALIARPGRRLVGLAALLACRKVCFHPLFREEFSCPSRRYGLKRRLVHDLCGSALQSVAI